VISKYSQGSVHVISWHEHSIHCDLNEPIVVPSNNTSLEYTICPIGNPTRIVVPAGRVAKNGLLINKALHKVAEPAKFIAF
jgi:hypothetical protein